MERNSLSGYCASILCVAICYSGLMVVQFHYLDRFNAYSLASAFFIPSSVRLFGVLLLGYRTGLGIVLGGLMFAFGINNLGQTPEQSLFVSVQAGLSCSASLLVFALVSNKVSGWRSPAIAFTQIDAYDVLFLSVIQSALNSGLASLIYYFLPGQLQPVTLHQAATMFMGDLTGAFLVFVLLNLLTSLALRLRGAARND
jgi:hypothetical protein